MPPLVSTHRLLWLRLCFTFFVTALIVLTICQIWLKDTKHFKEAAMYIPQYYFSLISLPYHTILVSTKSLDYLYLYHVYGSGVGFLFKSIGWAHHGHLDWSIFFGLMTVIYYVFSVPTKLLYLQTFEKATQIFWIDPESRKLQKVDSDALFRRLTRPWLIVLFSRVFSTGTRFVGQLFSARARHLLWDRGQPGHMSLDYFCYALLLWYEIYMYLQLTAEKSDWLYLFRSKNRFEQAYLACILIILTLGVACLILCFRTYNPWTLFAIEQIGHVIKLGRCVILWYYAKQEIDALDLVDVLSVRDSVQQIGRKMTLDYELARVQPSTPPLKMETFKQGERSASRDGERCARTPSTDGLYREDGETTTHTTTTEIQAEL